MSNAVLRWPQPGSALTSSATGYSPSPRIDSSGESLILDLWDRVICLVQPSVSMPALPLNVVEAIMECHLPAGWDGEDANEISGPTVELAMEFVQSVAQEAWRQGIPWQDPDISPIPNGGIDISWDTPAIWVSFTIKDGVSGIECAKQEAGKSPTHQLGSSGDAEQEALRAIASYQDD